MSNYEIAFAIIGGFFAGCINTLAGNGSVITLGFLTEVLGLPGNLANGTNRIGIVVQGLSSIQAFQKSGRLPLRSSWYFLVWGVAGAFVGTFVAIRISPQSFMIVFKYLMLLLLVFMLFNRKPVKNLHVPDFRLPAWIYIPVFFTFGFYGGFIQMGMGIFLLAFMLYYMKYPLLESNALKIVMVSGYTLIALIFFHFAGMVSWKIGLTIAIGQGFGGWLTAHWANKIPDAEKWAYRFLLLIMTLTLLKLFGFLHFIFSK